jgi:hypothetical protein
MDEPEDPQPRATEDDVRRVELPDDAALAEDAARVARTAAELGVEVPDVFLLTDVDE